MIQPASFRFTRGLALLLLCASAAFALPPAMAQETAQEGAQAPAEGAEAAPQASYGALADLLEDQAARQRLIEELRSLAAAEAAPAAADAAAPVVEEISLPRQIARGTQAFVESIGAQFSAIVANFTAEGPERAAFDAGAFIAAVVVFVLVAATTVGIYLLLRLLVQPLFARAAKVAEGGEPGLSAFLRRASAVVLSFIVDVVVILLACAGGYAAALLVFGEVGAIGVRQSLFINAFAMVEIFKAIIRLIFASRYPALRLLPLTDSVAGWWSIRLRSFSGVIGYTLLVAVPIINVSISPAIGALVGLIVVGAAYVYALAVIFKNRRLLCDRLTEKADTAEGPVVGVILRFASRTWHLIAIVYFTVLFVVSQARPEVALPFMIKASAQTLIAVAVGAILIKSLSGLLGRRLHLPARLNARLPNFEDRVNTYVPLGLHVVRALILIAVALLVLDAWAIFSLVVWLTSDLGAHLLAMVIHIGIILALAALLWTVCASIIEARLSAGEPDARRTTLMGLFRSALAIVIVTFTFMIVLSQIGVDIGPLIAGAGVLGLAIGFGSQKLVSDIITGVFIQMDNAMNVGDVVTVGTTSGTVERLGIRSTAIRDLDGSLHIVRFSSVDIVTNYMREFAFHVGEYRISYREDIDHAIRRLDKAFADLKHDEVQGPNILEDMTVPGVTSVVDGYVVIRIMIKTKPGSQWGVGRAFNRLVKMHFDAAGIELPFPHTTLYFGADREGIANPANVRVMQQDFAIEGGPAGQPKPKSVDDHGRSQRQSSDETHLDSDGSDER